MTYLRYLAQAGALGHLQQFDAIGSAASGLAVPFLLDEDGHDNGRVLTACALESARAQGAMTRKEGPSSNPSLHVRRSNREEKR